MQGALWLLKLIEKNTEVTTQRSSERNMKRDNMDTIKSSVCVLITKEIV